MKEELDYEIKHIKVLDGIRAISILIIVWFHFWQQTWLIPRIGIIDLDFLPRYGFLLVDMMILLSSFCLFLPYARSMVYNEKAPDTKTFYKKRIARIFPSYYLSLIIAFLFLIFTKSNWYNSFFIKDTLTHIFFVNNWSYDTLVLTNYFGVLRTVALEVQFYLIFPYIAKSFMKKPTLTYVSMMMIGIIGSYYIKTIIGNNMALYVNHFVTFIPVYANGMLASWFYISYTKDNKRSKVNNLFFTIISIFTIIFYVYLCKSIGTMDVQYWQFDNRLLLSLVFTLFIVCTCLSINLYQKIFSNKFMKFI